MRIESLQICEKNTDNKEMGEQLEQALHIRLHLDDQGHRKKCSALVLD